jgi:hypothetical protein
LKRLRPSTIATIFVDNPPVTIDPAIAPASARPADKEIKPNARAAPGRRGLLRNLKASPPAYLSATATIAAVGYDVTASQQGDDDQ